MQFGRHKRKKNPKNDTFHKKSTFFAKKFFMQFGPGKTQKIQFLKVNKNGKNSKNKIFVKYKCLHF